MPDVFEEITRWATRNLPFWEQAALDRILAGDPITNEIVDELVDYLLEDAGLEERKRIRPNLSHLALGTTNLHTSSGKVRLAKIHNLKNINALVPNQILEFGDDLTVIFGSNGSGKSGYARVIGSAAFTRGDKQILRNVTSAHPSEEPLSADIELKTQDGHTVSIHYLVGDHCPQLRSFYVFDSTSVKNHLTKENPMSFSPSGLESLTSLSALTDRVRKELDEKCAFKDCSKNVYDPLFVGESKVKAYVKFLGHATDLKALENLANVSDEERAKVDKLELQIAEIRSQRIKETIDQITQEMQDLENLRASIVLIEQWMLSEQFLQVNSLIEEYNRSEITIHEFHKANTSGFQSSRPDPYIWESFVRAAYALGQVESRSYPAQGDKCLLCGQPLSGDARDLIQHIWESINNEAETHRKDVGQKLETISSVLRKFNFDILDPRTSAYRCIQQYEPETLKIIMASFSESKQVCDQLQNAILNHRPVKLDPIRVIGSIAVQGVIDLLANKRKSLMDQNTDHQLQKLEKEKLELEHRVILTEQLDAIKDFVRRAKWVKQASAPTVKRSTKHITQKYNELFDQLVTQRYIHLFEQTLIKLKCPLRVRVDTHGSKGETRKQIVLLRDDNESFTDAAPDKVLSEGEQRAVALADFLTEVALNDNSSGILLDDPVTSLDFQWKETIAQHIVEEANRQQVIVFTHDLHFLHCLKKYADSQSILLTTHWIEKRSGIPGWVSLNQCPMDEKDYKKLDRARGHYLKANSTNLSAEERQFYLQQGFGALRTSYEAFIIFELFAGVIQRFDERIMPGSLKNVFIEENIIEDVDDSYGRISRYIEGHLHSDAFLAVKPEPEMLQQEIEHFEKLQAQLKTLKADAKKKPAKVAKP